MESETVRKTFKIIREWKNVKLKIYLQYLNKSKRFPT
jgi:hypothetical protein